MPEITTSGLGEKARSLFDDSTSAAQNVAGRTTAATGQTLSQGMESALDGMQQIQHKLEGAAQALPSAPTSSRLAWRVGRWLGRVEGVIWLGSKGAGIWWRRTRKQMQHQPPNERARMLVQWGPCVLATGWLAVQVGTQLGNRLRRSGNK